ncbi:MAG TPA: decaprenyl-phosphate phosphoribosyltransferase [Gemmatimonadaceae bacterium]
MTINATHPEPTGTPTTSRVSELSFPWIAVLRPRQWTKNLFILLPLLFSERLLDPTAVWRAAAAFACFCVLASAVYLMNDVMDRASDLMHPVKRTRPIASGQIAPRTALAVAVVLFGLGLTGSLLIAAPVAGFGALYVGLNILYTLRLKHVVILDVFTIAALFVVRLLVGTSAVAVTPSIWLLLCGGLLALYLAFAKRRHELVLLQEASTQHRAVLSQYSPALLDQLSGVLLAVTIVSYVMYTLESETARAINSDALAYSTVFVLYGVSRYLYLVHQRDGGDPTETLLTDRSLLASVVLWGLYCALVIYRPF